MFLFGIVLISLGSILPSLTTRFSLSDVAAGSLASLLPFGVLIGSVVFGPIVDRYSYKLLLVVCTVLVALGLEGIAHAGSFLFIQASIFTIGLGGGVLNGATNALVVDVSSEGRGASLSLLGVFFGIGALGMPAVLALLVRTFSQEAIIAGIGIVVCLVAVFFLAVRFPVPKQAQGFPLAKGLSLIKDTTLLLLGFILFFQSGMEGMVNNWTTTYLRQEGGASTEAALFALTCFVAGMTGARLVLSALLKRFSAWNALSISACSVLVGGVLLFAVGSYAGAVIGLVLIGIGFAAVFPVILGMIGDAYPTLSGTAFSIALVIALVGSTILNYLVGIMAQYYDIRFFPLMVLASLCVMVILIISTKRKVSPVSAS